MTMKSFHNLLKLSIAFGLGVIVTAIICSFLEHSNEIARKSAVDMPTASMIGFIYDDLQAGRINDAHAKIRKNA